jgi:hypothetical protein
MIIYQEIGGGLIQAHSDRGVLIRGGHPEADYVDPIDPASAGRTYTETEIPIPADDPEPPTVEEKAQAWDIITGAADGGEQA